MGAPRHAVQMIPAETSEILLQIFYNIVYTNIRILK